MTSPNPRLELWLRQKKQFELRAEVNPSAAWYWEIRCRIIRFLISRYGEASAEESTRPPSIFCTDRPIRIPGRPRNASNIQLKSPDRIRVLLADIRHEVAAARHLEVD